MAFSVAAPDDQKVSPDPSISDRTSEAALPDSQVRSEIRGDISEPAALSGPLAETTEGGANTESRAEGAVGIAAEEVSVFVFDWDDTFLPSTALGKRALTPEKLPEASRLPLQIIDMLGARVLQAALAIPTSLIMVLTNASDDWVHRTSRMYLPAVHSLLTGHGERIRVVSARPEKWNRRDLASVAPGHEEVPDVSSWKLDVVARLSRPLQRFIEERGARRVQVFGMGDMKHDLEAARALAGLIHAEEVWVKTVAMRPRPSAPELIVELGMLAGLWSALYETRGSTGCRMHLRGTSKVPDFVVLWDEEDDAEPRRATKPVSEHNLGNIDMSKTNVVRQEREGVGGATLRASSCT